MNRTLPNRTRAAGILIASAALLSAVLSACSGGSSSTVIPPASSTQNSTASSAQGTTSSTQVSAATEYVTLVAPVDVAQRVFKASTTGAEAEVRAGPFASTLENWSTGLSGFSWPSAAQADVRTLIAAIPPLVSDLKGVAAGDFADISKAKTDGAPVTLGAERVRSDLGLPATA